MSILYHAFAYLSSILQPVFFQPVELASEEDTLCNQRGDKHGADNGEYDHRHWSFFFGRPLGVQCVSFDGFLNVEADGEIEGDGCRRCLRR